MELLWKCAGIAVTAAALGLTIRKRSEEQAFLLGVLAAVLILFGILSAAGPAAETLRKLEAKSGVASELFSPLLKSLGIAVLGKLTEGFCRDAGQSAAASAMELAASFAILCAALPLVEALLDMIFSVL